MNDLYKSMIDQVSLAYAYHRIICDENGVPTDYEFVEVNPAFERMTGLKAEELIGKTVREALPGIISDEFDWIKEYGEIALKGGNKEFRQYSGHLDRWFKVNACSLEKNYFATFITDVTDELNKLAELETFFTVNLDLLCIASTDGYFLKLNQAWEDALGYSIQELIGRKFTDFIHEEDLPATLEAISELSRQKQLLNFVNRYRRKDGSYRFIQWRSQFLLTGLAARKMDMSYPESVRDDCIECPALSKLISFRWRLDKNPPSISVICPDSILEDN